jgi:hypothetical protein
MLLRRLYRWLAPVAVVLLTTAVAPAAGQDGESGPNAPVMGYFLAGLLLVLSLVILCMPSRRS